MWWDTITDDEYELLRDSYETNCGYPYRTSKKEFITVCRDLNNKNDLISCLACDYEDLPLHVNSTYNNSPFNVLFKWRMSIHK
jgi:hypothetical protein